MANFFNWFYKIETRIWHTKINPNTYLATISIILAAICGTRFGDISYWDEIEMIFDRVPTESYLGLMGLICVVNFAESIIAASNLSIGFLRALLISVITCISFFVGKAIPVITYVLFLSWIYISVVVCLTEIITRVVYRIRHIKDESLLVSNENNLLAETKEEPGTQKLSITYIALAVLYFIALFSRDDLVYDNRYFFFDVIDESDIRATIFLLLSICGWIFTIMSVLNPKLRLISNKYSLRTAGIALTIPLFFAFFMDAFARSFEFLFSYIGFGSYWILTISTITLIASYLLETKNR